MFAHMVGINAAVEIVAQAQRVTKFVNRNLGNYPINNTIAVVFVGFPCSALGACACGGGDGVECVVGVEGVHAAGAEQLFVLALQRVVVLAPLKQIADELVLRLDALARIQGNGAEGIAVGEHRLHGCLELPVFGHALG